MMELSHAAKLRAPFAPEQIGKLPKPTSRDNKKGNCRECGGYHGLPAVHLDYAGHAAVTDRLLQVDPEWTWEPMGRDANGLPLRDADGGLWIRLTVCGVTRPGYGDETNGKGMKEIIGDALRNAAMRFGVGLDLWSKQELLGMGTPEDPEELAITQAHLSTLRDMLTATKTEETKFLSYLKVDILEALPDERYPQALAALQAKKAQQDKQATS